MFSLLLTLSLCQPPPPAPWPMETLTLTNGAVLTGLLLDDTPQGLRFRVVKRPANRPTVTMTCLIPQVEVKAVKRLPEAERKILTEKLREHDDTTEGEGQRADELTLTPCTWPGLEKAALKYESEAFTLISSTSDEITRRTAIRLEQTFIAYSRYFPPRVEKAPPTTIYLAVDQDDYTAVFASVLKLTNPVEVMQHPAAYDPKSNSVFCGTNLRLLGADFAAARLHHVQQLAAVKRYEESINDLYKNAPRLEREKHQKTAQDERAKVLAADRRNDAKYDEAMAKLYAKLYHESFHAYAFNCVYPESSKKRLPRWLNEGLAQIFETAILDGYELRFGTPDRTRLTKVQTALKNGKGLMGVEELLLSHEGHFARSLPGQPDHSEAGYDTAWAVAYHLAFERKLLSTAKFEKYLEQIAQGDAPRQVFEKLVGQDLPSYERDFKDYFKRLQYDGTLKPK